MEPTLKVTEICDSMLAVVHLMVEQPQEATITAEQLTPNAATIKLRIAKTDAGKVIGKSGRTARSLRVLLDAVGMAAGVRITLNIESERPSSS